jgi:hypothetical protein
MKINALYHSFLCIIFFTIGLYADNAIPTITIKNETHYEMYITVASGGAEIFVKQPFFRNTTRSFSTNKPFFISLDNEYGANYTAATFPTPTKDRYYRVAYAPKGSYGKSVEIKKTEG